MEGKLFVSKNNEEIQALKDKAYELSRTGWDLGNERREAEVFELKEPLSQILSTLRADIDTHHIRTLVGDDSSGRIPTLILKKVLTELYQETTTAPPSTLFIQGPGGGKPVNEKEDEERVRQLVEHLQKCISYGEIVIGPSHKVLIVTEVIKSGKSLIPIVMACKQLGITYEIVSLGIEKEKSKEQLEEEFGVKIHSGMAGTPSIYRKPAFSGVGETRSDTSLDREVSENGLLAKRYVDTQYHKESAQLWINEMRREVTILADELLEEYKQRGH
jgi:hypothetical protein